MRVSVIGTGYVGLVTGVCLAQKGHSVICVDLDPERVRTINNGVSPIYERGLDDLLQGVVGVRLSARTDLHAAVLETDLSLIAVGTPFDGAEIDLSAIRMAACQIGAALKDKAGYHVVVVKSTVVPGTTDRVVVPALESTSGKAAGSGFGAGMNPEFLREGEAVLDFMNPDRIVMGGIDQKSLDALEELYQPFQPVDTIRTGNSTAEMIKYASNTFFATLISFSNEIANLCAASGSADVRDVLRAIHLDKRLSPILPDGGGRIVPHFTTYLEAGCGFGGSCFPKDSRALIAYAKSIGSRMPLLQAVMEVNDAQPGEVMRFLKKHFPNLDGAEVAVLGLAFKPGTDDIRESPAIPIVRSLVEAGARARVYDPVAVEEARKVLPWKNVHYAASLEEAVAGADAVAVLTKWEEFRSLPQILRGITPPPLVVDGRRLLDKSSVARYEGIGL